METFDNIDSMWIAVLGDLFDRGKTSPSRVGRTIYENGYVARLSNIQRTFLTNSVRRLDPKYAAAEFLWYFDPTGSIDMITKYAPQYKNFAEPSGEVHGAYGKRFVYYFKPLISQLKIEGNRRCVIALYESSDLMHPQAKDIPCTLNWQFIVDEDKLCMIANMRSNDVWLGMPYDIYVNTLIQRVVASNLGLECGWYQHQVMNIHLYERDWKKVEDMTSYATDPRPLFVKDTLTTLEMIQWAQSIEKVGGNFNVGYASPLISDVLSCITGQEFENEVLQDAYIRRHGPGRKDNASSQVSEAPKDDLPAHWSSP